MVRTVVGRDDEFDFHVRKVRGINVRVYCGRIAMSSRFAMRVFKGLPSRCYEIP